MGWRGVLVWGQSGTWLWRAAVVMVERSPSGAGPATKWRSTFIKNTLHQVCSFCLNNKLFTCNPAIYATATGYVRNKLESSKQTFSPSPAAAADVAGQWWDPETSSPDYDTLPVTLTHSWLPHPLLQSSVKKSESNAWETRTGSTQNLNFFISQGQQRFKYLPSLFL